MSTIFTSTSAQYVLEHQHPRSSYSEPSFDSALSHPLQLHEQHEHYLDHHLRHLEHQHPHEHKDNPHARDKHAHKRGPHGLQELGHGEVRRRSHSVGAHEAKGHHHHHHHGHREVNVVFSQLEVLVVF